MSKLWFVTWLRRWGAGILIYKFEACWPGHWFGSLPPQAGIARLRYNTPRCWLNKPACIMLDNWHEFWDLYGFIQGWIPMPHWMVIELMFQEVVSDALIKTDPKGHE